MCAQTGSWRLMCSVASTPWKLFIVPPSLITIISNSTLSSINDPTDLPHFPAWLLALLHPSAPPSVPCSSSLSLSLVHSLHFPTQSAARCSSTPNHPPLATLCMSGIARSPPSCEDTSEAIKRKDWTEMLEGKKGE